MQSEQRNFGRLVRSLAALGLFVATLQLNAAVVGSGTAGSCTEAALDTVLAGTPATVTFNCGAAPVTITLTTQKALSTSMTIDGGNLVTLDGNNVVRQFSFTGSGTAVTLRGLTFINGAGAPALNTTGGAVYFNSNASLTIDTVTFSNNHSKNGGGAVEIVNGNLVVTASTFANNSATGFGAGGGAIESLIGTGIAVTNSTFVSNGGGASTTGSAIEVNTAPTVTITNSTFSGNNGDGAVEADGGVTMTLRNTIVAATVNGANCRTFSTGTIVDGGGNVQFGGTIANSCGAGVATGDPVLGPLANNGGPTQTQALGAGSAAIDAGNDATCLATDQRGTARPLGAHCDAGAFEAPAVVPVAPTITNGPPPGGTVGSVYSFAYTATGSNPITFSVTSGALPNGLSISAAGAITGTPTQPGTFTGVVTASNGTLPNATQAFSIVIASVAVAPTITNGPPPGGTVGSVYSFAYTATGTNPITFAVTSGALPNGLSISASGAITGTPTQAGTFAGVVTASNGTLPNATQAFSIMITAPVVAVAAVPAPTLGQLAMAILMILICAGAGIAQRARARVAARGRRRNDF